MHIFWDGRADQHDDEAGVGAAAHRRRLPGADVHVEWTHRAVLEGVREEQLQRHEVGALPHQG